MSKLYYSKTHEWIEVEGNMAKIGISEHAAKELGDLVFVELPEVGSAVKCGGLLCNVESVKAVSELYSPACGKIVAVNEELESDPSLINSSARTAWIVQIEVEKLNDGLMSEEEYTKLV